MSSISRLRTTALVALALAVLPATAASAHVRVVPEQTTAGGWTVLTFRVPNESETAATSQVAVDLPTDTPLLSVSTKPLPGWTATVETAPLPEPVDFYGTTLTEAPARVVWTAQPGAEIADGQFQEFEVSAGPLPDAGTRLVLPAHQTYTDGTVVDWADVAEEGAEEPEHPAPELTTTEGADEHAADPDSLRRVGCRGRRRGRRRVRGRSDDVGARHARAGARRGRPRARCRGPRDRADWRVAGAVTRDPRPSRGLLALSLALAAVVLGAPAAQAHNVLQSTDPAAGSTVPYVPELVSLTFNEPVLFVGTTIMVHTADDTMVNIGPPILVDNTVSQAVTGELPAGEYQVIYRVTSADGHPVEGEYTFTAAESMSYGVTTPPATEPATPSPTEVTPTASERAVPVALALARPHRESRLGAGAPRGRRRARGDRRGRRLAAAPAAPDGTA